MLTLLTTTGERLECFDLLKQFMMAQDYDGPVRWVIVDDGREPADIEFKRDGWTVEVFRPDPPWQPGQNTQHRNLAHGLEQIKDDERVVIIEDDDFYGPKHLSKISTWLSSYHLVGERWPRYFNIRTGCGQELRAPAHTSLAASAFKAEALKEFRHAVKRKRKFVDIDLWRNYYGVKKLYMAGNTIGIKGMPGRGGIGQGHLSEFGSIVDPAEYLGEAFGYYEPFILKATIEGTEFMRVKTLKQHNYAYHIRRKGDEYFINRDQDFKVLKALGLIEEVLEPKKKPGRPKKVVEPIPVENPVDENAEVPEIKEEIETPRNFKVEVTKDIIDEE